MRPTSAAQSQTASGDSFLKSLADSGVLSATEVSQATGQIPAGQRQDARLMAQELVKQGKLTRYQAMRLLHGKANGLVLGHYVIQEELGRGGMGVVYKAVHRGLQRVVALKVLLPEVTRQEITLRRFHREVQAAAKLNHPNIVAAHDAGEAQGTHFLVMEYVEGCDLAQWVGKHGPLPTNQAVDAILQAARGLAYAHGAGIVHRDIKPSNLLRDTKNTVKVLDLGLARIDKPGDSRGNENSLDDLTKTGSIMGTCDYMAPEQARNIKAADQRSDIYSLGCSFYFLLAGKPMYPGETAMEKVFAHQEKPVPSLPAAAKAWQPIFKRMVAKRPQDRFQSIDEVVLALQGKTGKSRRRLAGRVWWLAGGAAVAALALLALVIGRGTQEHAQPAVQVPPSAPVAEVVAPPAIVPATGKKPDEFRWAGKLAGAPDTRSDELRKRAEELHKHMEMHRDRGPGGKPGGGLKRSGE